MLPSDTAVPAAYGNAHPTLSQREGEYHLVQGHLRVTRRQHQVIVIAQRGRPDRHPRSQNESGDRHRAPRAAPSCGGERNFARAPADFARDVDWMSRRS
jgi:hypothetical protein